MKILIASQNETEQLARRIAACAQPGDVIALHGDLGVGKSVFARQFIRALTHENEEVPSPTFTLVQVYDTDQTEIFHFDLYRLDHPDDSLELGVEEAFNDGISLVEWPQRLGPYLPWDCLNITLAAGESGENSRIMTLNSQGDWQQRIEGIDTP